MTNLEWIRTLTEEELAELLEDTCEMCIRDCDNCSCIPGHIKWLKAEHVFKIKPCANCGGKAIFVVDPMRINPELGCVQCCECHIRTPVGTKHNVVNIWNKRVNNGGTIKTD